MLTPLALLRHFGEKMVERRRGGIILMSSVAALQGSGYLTTYAGTKSFLKVLAESLWCEWRPYNVDVIACCAGATATPSYFATNPVKASPLEPRPRGKGIRTTWETAAEDIERDITFIPYD
jgi:short-subunit dehydrogenase